MKRILGSLVVALATFILLNFFYSNLGGEAFRHPLYFEFNIPFLPPLMSHPVPVGFLLIVAFCLGMVFLPLLQLIPSLFRGAQIRSRDRRIKELEQELEMVQKSSIPDPSASSSEVP